MKQTASMIAVYSANIFGVCSALYELDGMIVVHDPSGCNSTYSTHNEPRWYNQESRIYISGLREVDAVMGNEQKFIDDVEETAKAQKPRFIVIVNSPVPRLIGMDLDAIAKIIARDTGLPVFHIPTDNIFDYVQGISSAFKLFAEHFVTAPPNRSHHKRPHINIIGITPLDFSWNKSEISIKRWLNEYGFNLQSCWSVGTSYDELSHSAEADASLVVSYGGLAAARLLEERYHIPYVIGVPIGDLKRLLAQYLMRAIDTGISRDDVCGTDARSAIHGRPAGAIIGESIYSASLAAALTLESGVPFRVICPLTTDRRLLMKGDSISGDEESLMRYLPHERSIIADPLYKPIIPNNIPFIPLGHEAFSGRIFRNKIPNLIDHFDEFFQGILDKNRQYQSSVI